MKIKILKLMGLLGMYKLQTFALSLFVLGVTTFGVVAYKNTVSQPRNALQQSNREEGVLGQSQAITSESSENPDNTFTSNPSSTLDNTFSEDNAQPTHTPTQPAQNTNNDSPTSSTNSNSDSNENGGQTTSQPTSTPTPSSTSSPSNNESFNVTTSNEGSKFTVVGNQVLDFCYKSETSPSGNLTVSTNDTSNNTDTCEFNFSNEGWKYAVIVKNVAGEEKKFEGTIKLQQSTTKDIPFEYSVSEAGDTYVVSVNKELNLCSYLETNSTEQPMSSPHGGSVRQAGVDTTCTINRQNPNFSYFYIYLLSVDDDSRWIPVKYPPNADWLGNL